MLLKAMNLGFKHIGHIKRMKLDVTKVCKSKGGGGARSSHRTVKVKHVCSSDRLKLIVPSALVCFAVHVTALCIRKKELRHFDLY
jgi:hypothetical protein